MTGSRTRAAAAAVLGLVLTVCVSTAPTAHAETPGLEVVAGGNGSGPGLHQFGYPQSVDVDAAGNVYVSDLMNARVVRWAPGATQGVVVAGGNGEGAGLDQLHSPSHIAVAADGTVFVSDRLNHRVVRWDPGATAGVVVAGGNGPGAAANQLNHPHALALDDSGAVYVADFHNPRVMRWDPGATSGVVVAGGNGSGQELHQLDSVFGVAVDGARSVYISDISLDRVVRWTPGATAGEVVAGLAPGEPGPSSLAYPAGLDLDTHGNLVIADGILGEILLWSPGAAIGHVIADLSPEHFDQEISPQDVAVHDGYAYIADTRNDRIVRLRLPGSEGGINADVLVLEPAGPCLLLNTTAIHFFGVELGDSAVGDTESRVTNCGDRDVRLFGRVSGATGPTARWQPLDEQRAVTCADGLNRFSYRLTEPLSLEQEAADFLGSDNRELERTLAPGSFRSDEHTLFLPCPGSSGENELVTMTVVYTGTQA